MALKLPRHRVDAPAVYVCADDDAWIDANSEATKDYLGGVGRYDPELLAPLLDESKGPAKFVIHRPTRAEFLAIESMRAINGVQAAIFAAAQTCLRGMTGWTCRSWERNKAMTSDEFDDLDREVGRRVLEEVGTACLLVAKDLTEPEKKASAS